LLVLKLVGTGLASASWPPAHFGRSSCYPLEPAPWPTGSTSGAPLS
jgi:hypothetical protein